MNEESKKLETPEEPDRKARAWAPAESIQAIDRRLARDGKDAAVSEIAQLHLDLAAYRNAHEHLTIAVFESCLERNKEANNVTKLRNQHEAERKESEEENRESLRVYSDRVERLHEALSFLGMTDRAILAITDGSKGADELFPKAKGVLKSKRS